MAALGVRHVSSVVALGIQTMRLQPSAKCLHVDYQKTEAACLFACVAFPLVSVSSDRR